MLRARLYPEEVPEPRMFEGRLCYATGYECFLTAMGRWQREWESDDGEFYYAD